MLSLFNTKSSSFHAVPLHAVARCNWPLAVLRDGFYRVVGPVHAPHADAVVARCAGGARLRPAPQQGALAVVDAVGPGAPEAVQHQVELPEHGLAQEDVHPGVQDLVPGGHAHHHQQAEGRRFRLGLGGQHDDVDLARTHRNRL